jgi:hypothetical protein
MVSGVTRGRVLRNGCLISKRRNDKSVTCSPAEVISKKYVTLDKKVLNEIYSPIT